MMFADIRAPNYGPEQDIFLFPLSCGNDHISHVQRRVYFGHLLRLNIVQAK